MVPIQANAAVFSLCNLDLDPWLPSYRRIAVQSIEYHPFTLPANQAFSMLVRLRAETDATLGVNGPARDMTEGRSTVYGDIVVVKHSSDGTAVLDMEAHDEQMSDQALH